MSEKPFKGKFDKWAIFSTPWANPSTSDPHLACVIVGHLAGEKLESGTRTSLVVSMKADHTGIAVETLNSRYQLLYMELKDEDARSSG